MIFFMGTDLLSSAHTSVVLLYLMRLLHIPLSHFDLVHATLRKTAHFTGYAVLSLLLFRAWRASLPERRRVLARLVTAAHIVTSASRVRIVEPLWTLRWSALAIAVSALIATLDEFHQSFVPSRTANPRDVALDTMGALFAQLLVMLALLGRWREESS